MTRHRNERWRGAVTWGAAAVTALAAACSSGGGGEAGGEGTEGGDPAAGEPAAVLPEGYEGHTSETYADDRHWLCRPGAAGEVCSRDLDATAVAADGSTEVLRHEPAEDPPVDCFYVYPTTSRDPGPNSDLEPGETEEVLTAWNQAARLTASCRVFAPVYRQVTLSAILGDDRDRGGDGEESPGAVAYGDVLDAFKHYLANDSEGRGFVLIGHSQGGGLLARLIADEIDPEPLLRDRLVAAYILGASVQVPEGEAAGGTFDQVPLCERDDQTGCVVSYASYRATRPPPPSGLFGRSGAGTRAACVNPADVAGGGPADLEPYFLVDPPEGALLGGEAAQPFADAGRGAEITTPWVTYPGLVTGECAGDEAFTYLSLTVDGDPADPRTDDIGGDLTEEWGMHLVDANVAMGDIVRLVAAQGAAYAG
ncbi:MAG TPA: DUF3089 domain-containing protein [Acidimicrobiales bacterium]